MGDDTQLRAGTDVCAIRGLAGTGKSTLIPALEATIKATGAATVAVGTPTHRAAAVLKHKGVTAKTVHALALELHFSQEYTACERWLALPRCDPDMPPLLVESLDLMRLAQGAATPSPLQAYSLQRNYDGRTVLAALGIHLEEHITGYGPRAEAGEVLIIDEASMVGAEMLELAQEAFTQIVLIGDHGQLPPVQDRPVLWDVPAVTLQTIHRQVAGSPILELAYAVRQGAPLRAPRQSTGAITTLDAMPAEAAREVPLLVWRNKVRLSLTAQIRRALGYPVTQLVVGEPLVCRAHSAKARLLGLYNNGLFRVAEVFPDQPRMAVIRDDTTGDTCTVRLHLEEWDGMFVPPGSIVFRLGYCLTVHTAQGSEWDTVAVLLPEATAYRGACGARGQAEESRRWTYTAVTRARRELWMITTATVDAPGATPHAEGGEAWTVEPCIPR